MALNKELWLSEIIGPLRNNNSFIRRSLDHSTFIDGKQVHVPCAMGEVQVAKDRATFPATPGSRDDIDVHYPVSEFSTSPIFIPFRDRVEQNANARAATISQMRDRLEDAITEEIVSRWLGGCQTNVITGASMADNLLVATDTYFSQKRLPRTGRCLLVKPSRWIEILGTITSKPISVVLPPPSVPGAATNLFGFDVYIRQTISEAYPNVYAMAWQQDCVSHAIGGEELFVCEGNPLYYGEVVSALVRAGGSRINVDNEGVVAFATEDDE